MKKELEQVRESLKWVTQGNSGSVPPETVLADAVHTLDKLIAAQEQEPIGKLVVTQHSDSGIGIEFLIDKPEELLNVGQFVYTAPQPVAQPEQEPVIGTKTWFEDGKLVTQNLVPSDVYEELPGNPMAKWPFPQAEQAPVHPDDIAVDKFADAMKAKMAKQRAKGYGGWDDKAECPEEHLQAALFRHVAKGDPVDVGNFAMMLWNRGNSTEYADQWVFDLTGKWPMKPTSKVPEQKTALYWRLHTLSKSLEDSGRIDESDCTDAYSTILNAMRMARQVEQKTVQRLEDAKDAARYRWLRSKDTSLEAHQHDKGIFNSPSCYHMVEGIRELKWGEALDAAVDSSRAAWAALSEKLSVKLEEPK